MKFFEDWVASLTGIEAPRPQALIEQAVQDAARETNLAKEREAQQLERVREQAKERMNREEEETISLEGLEQK